MSMNYNDGFLYGMEMVQSYYETWNYLVRVNPVNGEVLRLCELDMNTYGYAFGNMAIDHDGNFYIISIDITNYKTMLVKFRLVNDEVTGIETASLADWPTYNYGSMVYSGANNGIFWANDAGQLLWLDGSDMGNVKVMLLGDIAGMEYGATNMGLLEIPDEEPSDTLRGAQQRPTWLTATCAGRWYHQRGPVCGALECPGGRRLLREGSYHRHGGRVRACSLALRLARLRWASMWRHCKRPWRPI